MAYDQNSAYRPPNRAYYSQGQQGQQAPQPRHAQSTREVPQMKQQRYEQAIPVQQNYPRQAHAQPQYVQPEYEQRTYERQAYDQPVYEQWPIDEQPAYGQSHYDQPHYDQPAYNQEREHHGQHRPHGQGGGHNDYTNGSSYAGPATNGFSQAANHQQFAPGQISDRAGHRHPQAAPLQSPPQHPPQQPNKPSQQDLRPRTAGMRENDGMSGATRREFDQHGPNRALADPRGRSNGVDNSHGGQPIPQDPAGRRVYGDSARSSPPRRPQIREKSAPPARRRPLIEVPSPIGIPQDTAFPTFPTKKEAPKSKTRDSTGETSLESRASSGEHVRPSTAGNPSRSHHGSNDNNRPFHHADAQPADNRSKASGAIPHTLNERRNQRYDDRQPHGPNGASAGPQVSHKPHGDRLALVQPRQPQQPQQPQQTQQQRMADYGHQTQREHQPPTSQPAQNRFDAGHYSERTGPVMQPPPINRSLTEPSPSFIDPNRVFPGRTAQRPSTATDQPAMDVSHSHGNMYLQQPQVDERHKRETLGDFYDDYYTMNPAPRAQTSSMILEAKIEAEMPDFDDVGGQTKTAHQRGLTIDKHLNDVHLTTSPPPLPTSNQIPGQGPPAPAYVKPVYQNGGHTVSQPDLRGGNASSPEMAGFDFGIPVEPAHHAPQTHQYRRPLPQASQPRNLQAATHQQPMPPPDHPHGVQMHQYQHPTPPPSHPQHTYMQQYEQPMALPDQIRDTQAQHYEQTMPRIDHPQATQAPQYQQAMPPPARPDPMAASFASAQGIAFKSSYNAPRIAPTFSPTPPPMANQSNRGAAPGYIPGSSAPVNGDPRGFQMPPPGSQPPSMARPNPPPQHSSYSHQQRPPPMGEPPQQSSQYRSQHPQQQRAQNGMQPPPQHQPQPQLRDRQQAPQSSSPSLQTMRSNPDSLPHHPAPIRPGLMGLPPAQPSKPAPIRQYTQTSNNKTANPSRPQTATPRASIDEQSQSLPVTQTVLDQLRAKVDANPRDHNTALVLAKKLVEASSVLASENGRLDAKSTSKNRERYVLDAHKRIKRLVSAGYPEAMFYLAECYGEGMLGLEVDTKEAFSLYQAAAKAGHAAAAYRTAVCCEIGPDEGGGTRKDLTKAVQWYRRAAELHDSPAMYKLGVILLKGLLGQQKNTTEAVIWLKKAAEKADASNPHALHELGILHEPGNPDPAIREKVPADETYAREMFMRSATLGYKFSQFRLGQAYEYGNLGLPIDARSSIAWYSKAAAQGEHGAELALSGWYLTGSEGILEHSDAEAYLWARKAATSEMPKAMFAMGYYSENGIGCPASLEDAKRWYSRAASLRFPKASERLEELRKGGARAARAKPVDGRLRRDQKRVEAECALM